MTYHTTQAMFFEPHQFKKLRKWIAENSQMKERDDLMFLLSFHGGLRASEIAKIDLEAMFDVEGKIANRIVVTSKVGKRGSTREVPMTPDLIDSLIKFMRRYPEATFVALGTYKNQQRMKPTAVKAYMWYVYKKAGFKMGSSHSGRRTYITNLARTMNNFGLSLRDVQEMAGHARLNTTQGYVEANPARYAAAAFLPSGR
jgi:integrase/recombinase XerD